MSSNSPGTACPTPSFAFPPEGPPGELVGVSAARRKAGPTRAVEVEEREGATRSGAEGAARSAALRPAWRPLALRPPLHGATGPALRLRRRGGAPTSTH